MTAMTRRANREWKNIPSPAVVALFKQTMKRGPWPNESQCYRLANAITIVANHALPKANNELKGYRKRRAIYTAMLKLVRKQKVDQSIEGLRLPGFVSLEGLEEALLRAKDSVLAPYDPLAGERRGAGWHKAARFMAPHAEDALRAARRTVSRDKRSPLVKVIAAALKLAGQGARSDEAVAGALANFPPK
jgi:hypothetical protein